MDEDAEVVAYDYRTGTFFLGNGGRAEYVEVVHKELTAPSSVQSLHFPSLGKYATCWLGDCIITSLNGRRAVLRTTCGRYAVAPRLLRPLRSACTVHGLRVLYGSGGARCLVFPSLTCSGGAVSLLEELMAKMASTPKAKRAKRARDKKAKEEAEEEEFMMEDF